MQASDDPCNAALISYFKPINGNTLTYLATFYTPNASGLAMRLSIKEMTDKEKSD